MNLISMQSEPISSRNVWKYSKAGVGVDASENVTLDADF